MESSGLTKMMIEGLPVLVTEAQILALIIADKLPRPDHLELRKTLDSATAILHFETLVDALKFRNKKNGKFLSTKTNISVQAAPIITSTILQQPPPPPPENPDPPRQDFYKPSSSKVRVKRIGSLRLPPSPVNSTLSWKDFCRPSSAHVEASKTATVKTEKNICDNQTMGEIYTSISVKDEPILDSPVYDHSSHENSPVYEPVPYGQSPQYEPVPYGQSPQYEPVPYYDNSPLSEDPSYEKSPEYEPMKSPQYEPVPYENSPLYESLPYDPEEDIEKNILSNETLPYDPEEDIEKNILSNETHSGDEASLSISPEQLQTNLSFIKVISDPDEAPYDPGDQMRNIMGEEPKPQTIKLKTIKVRTNLTAPKTPSTPRTPVDCSELTIKVDEKEEEAGPEPSEVVLVNIHFSPEEKISQVRVYLVNSRKNQNFYGKEPAILVGGLLRYIKKYHPLPTTEIKMVLVTPCVFSYGAFCEALNENQENKKLFLSYFSHWLDLQSLNNNYCVKEKKLKMVKGVKCSSNKVRLSSVPS